MPFERRGEKLLPRRAFISRVVKFTLLSLSLVFISLIIGILGYMLLGGLSLVDAFLNSAMIMG